MKALTARGLFALTKRERLPRGIKPMSIDFMPVYIPADTLWKGSVEYFSEVIPDETDRDHILSGLFVNHCLREIVIAMEGACEVGEHFRDEELPSWALKIDEVQEEKIARLCSHSWKLDRTQTSFLGLKLAVLDRINTFRSAINGLDTSNALVRVREFEPLDIMVLLKAFADVMESFAGIKKWAFSFDEMEIAPKRIVSLIYENLRSFDQRIVLKFSLYPHVDFYNYLERAQTANAGPVPDQDYKPISLALKFSNPDTDFANKLIASECQRRGVQFHVFRNYLNASKAIKKGTRAFGDNSTTRNFRKIFKTVSREKVDQSALEYLKRKDLLDSDNVESLSENQRAAQIRKVAPIIEFRSYYFAHFERDGQSMTRRSSVKSFSYYHGFEQLALITEGNPRAIQHYVNELIDSLNAGVPSNVAQNRSVGRNLDRFRALVATQAIKPEPHAVLTENALDLVDSIGEILVQGVLAAKFSTQPSLSVKFRSPRPETKRLLATAINAGALVPDADDSQHGKILFDVEGVRLRVSYRLVQFFPLPTITGQVRVLSTKPSKVIQPPQPDLLGWALEND